MATDIATRVYNHAFRIDPAIRTLLDTDFYKLLMLQMIWKMHPKRQVTFQLINRTTSVRLADFVDERELTDQLDHARTLRLAKNELIWLAGNTFYGTRQIFEPAFMEWLVGFRLPEYELTRRDGQYELRFAGPWTGTTMWEIPGARDHQRTPGPRRDARHEPVRSRRALRPGEGEAVVQGRAAARSRARGAFEGFGFRHPPAPQLSLASLVRRGDAGGARRQFHRHVQRQARDGHRPRGDRHQRPRTADGLCGASPATTRTCARRRTRC